MMKGRPGASFARCTGIMLPFLFTSKAHCDLTEGVFLLRSGLLGFPVPAEVIVSGDETLIFVLRCI